MSIINHPRRIEIGANLRRLRVSKGLSLEEVGERIGVTYQQIQKYELGTNRISVDALLCLAETFGVEASDILDPSSKKVAKTPKTVKEVYFEAVIEFAAANIDMAPEVLYMAKNDGNLRVFSGWDEFLGKKMTSEVLINAS